MSTVSTVVPYCLAVERREAAQQFYSASVERESSTKSVTEYTLYKPVVRIIVCTRTGARQ